MRLTPVGERVIGIARSILGSVDELERTAEAYRDPEAGTLRLGTIPTIAPYLIPLFPGSLRERFPALDIRLVEDTTDRLFGRLEAGDLEAAVIATAPDDPRLPTIPLYREPFWSALPHGHALERGRRRPSRAMPCRRT